MKEIKFSLVYRDMWQSSGKYVPRLDQLVRVAPAIIDMGCFARVETNGGGFEQINLLFGENPNKAVRAWCKPFNEAGIQTHMLERTLNGLRMNPVSEEVRRMMFRVKKLQGTDIARSFCGLNDVRNIERSIRFAKEGGMIAQAALSITVSPIHTVEYYVRLAEQLIAAGADEICIKDMAGIGRPTSLGKIVHAIKTAHPHILVQYHGHAGPGFAATSLLEVARAGADIVDVGMEPLSWGTGHVDLLTAHAMLKDDGFSVPDINMDAYMEVRRLTQEFIDDFLGLYIDPRNRLMNSLLIGSGLPGGMMGSLMADLNHTLESLNKWGAKNGKTPLTQDQLLVMLFQEVEHIWPLMGYPPLVTPYSQYVKNIAVFNVTQLYKGKERFSIIDDNTWDMLLGKSGRLPGPLAPELQALAQQQGREFFTGDPQDNYPDDLHIFRKEMEEKGWDVGQDEEELFELAMHPQQYRAYKSGEAKKAFEADLAKHKGAKEPQEAKPAAVAAAALASFQPQEMTIEVDGQRFAVKVSYENSPAATTAANTPAQPTATAPAATPAAAPAAGGFSVIAPLEGRFFRTKSPSEKAIQVGEQVAPGTVIGYIESMKVYNAITAEQGGKVAQICFADGESVEEDATLLVLA